MCNCLSAALCVAVLFPALAFTQSKGEGRELDSRNYYKKWLNEDVVYIISDEERDVFVKLTTDEERDQFIEQFWLRRDSVAETAENEFKLEHYRRILYANEKFTAGIPGWKSDRGRIYIKFGPPDRFETNPAGGSYERPRKEGGGHTSVAPFEIWEYRHIPDVGDDIELEFVDDKGGGLYELTFDNQRKDDLRQSGFLGPTWDEIEAYETRGAKLKQDRVVGRRYAGDLSGDYRNTAGFETHRDAPFSKLLLSANLDRAPAIRYKDLETVVSARISYSKVPVELGTGFLKISAGQVLVPVTLQVPNAALTYKQQYGVYSGRLQVFGQVTTLAKRRETLFEDEVAREFTESEYQSGLMESSLFQKYLILRPGLYKLDLVVKDVHSGGMTTIERRLEVPEFLDERLTMSSVILASVIQKSDEKDNLRFHFGSLRVVPRVNGTFRKDEQLGFYFQVYGFQTDTATKKPGAKVEFAVTPRGKDPAYWRDASDLLAFHNTHSTVARIGSLSAFPPGDYELRIRVTDKIASAQTSASVPFKILAPLP